MLSRMEGSHTFYTLPNQNDCKRKGIQSLPNVRRVYSFHESWNTENVNSLQVSNSHTFVPNMEISTPVFVRNDQRGRPLTRRHERCQGSPRVGTSWDGYSSQLGDKTGFGRRFHSAERKWCDTRYRAGTKANLDCADARLNCYFDTTDQSNAEFSASLFLSVRPHSHKYVNASSERFKLHTVRSQTSWCGAISRSRPSKVKDFLGSDFSLRSGCKIAPQVQMFSKKHFGIKSSCLDNFNEHPRGIVGNCDTKQIICNNLETPETSSGPEKWNSLHKNSIERSSENVDVLLHHPMSEKVNHYKFAQTEDCGQCGVGNEDLNYIRKCDVYVLEKSPLESTVYKTLPNRTQKERSSLTKKAESFNIVSKVERTSIPRVRDENQNELRGKSVFVKCQAPQLHSNKAFLLTRTKSKSRFLKTEEQVKLAKFRRFFSSANIDSHEFKTSCLVRINTALTLRKEDTR